VKPVEREEKEGKGREIKGQGGKGGMPHFFKESTAVA